MFRFTIRDVLWLTVVVALGCGWIREAYRSPSRRIEFRAEALELKLKREGWTVEQPKPYHVVVTKGSVIEGFFVGH
jgi:hypothetical protein